MSERADATMLDWILAEGFIPAWKSRPAGAPGVGFMNSTLEIIYSSTLDRKPFGEGSIVERSIENEGVGREGHDCSLRRGNGAQSVAARVVHELFLLVDPARLEVKRHCLPVVRATK